MTQSNSQTVTIQIEGVEVEGIKVAKACITLTGQVTDASLYQRFSFAKWLLSAVGPFYKKVIENFLDMGDKEPTKEDDKAAESFDNYVSKMEGDYMAEAGKQRATTVGSEWVTSEHDDACKCAICSIERIEKEELS
jgi:hypothetical protein